jgi:GxxExxY protein
MLVADKVVVELKVVDSLLPVHKAQLLSYMKLSGKKLGLLINFNEAVVKDGVKRIVNKL